MRSDPLRVLIDCETSGAVRLAAQLSLFAWADPPPPKPAPRGGCGFRVWHPCACGSTHSMLFVTDPYNVLALRWWTISRHSPHTLEMMTERLIAWGLMPASPGPDRWKFRSRTFDGIANACADQWGGWAQQEARA